MNEEQSNNSAKNQGDKYIRISFFRFATFEVKGYSHEEATSFLKRTWWFPLIVLVVIVVLIMVFGERVFNIGGIVFSR